LLASLVLAGCGGATPTAEAPEGEQPPAEEAVTLVFWSMWNEPEPQALAIAKWIDAFEAEHPNITIDVVWNGRENQTKARTALAGGTVIDLVDQDADQIAGGMMSEGLGYPLDEFLSQKALDEDVPITDVFYPGLLDVFKMDGKTYLWPYVDNPVMWWYNKAMFEEVGVTPPTTWDEFLAVSQKIKDAGYAPIAVEGDVFDYNMFIYNYYITRLKGKGFLLSVIEDKTGESWKDPAIIDSMAAMRELWDKGFIPPESQGYVWPAGQTTLALGETAMEMCGGWLPTELKDTAGEDFKWGGFRMPAVSGGVGDIDDLHSWLLAFMILKDSKHPAEAFEFLKFMMTKENMEIMAKDALVGVTRKGVEWAAPIADGAAASETAKQGLLHVDGGYAFHAEFVTNVLNEPFLDAFYLRITPEEFASTMAERAAEYWASK
jgi:ABC-type glycerol-3-phosphate transport system substrate-binding protein